MQQFKPDRPATGTMAPAGTRIISSGRTRPLVDWAELWAYREVMLQLVWRSVKTRYRQTYFGLLWAVVQPLVALGVYSVIFGRLVGVPSEGVPYPLFVLCGLVPWNFITRSVLAMTGSVLSDQELVKHVYFPRLAVPISAFASSFSNTFFGLLILVGALAYYAMLPPVQVVLAPVFFVLAAAVAMGVGLIAAALNVRFRDVGYAMPFATQTLMFLTPVIYPATLLPDSWRLIYAINPVVGIIGGLRWSILGIPADLPVLLISAAGAISLLLAGLWTFARSEDGFADVI